MTWVRRAAPVDKHECTPPISEEPWFWLRAVGQHGDLWRCDDCGLLWVVRDAFNTNGPEWRQAGWWTRRRYRHAGWGPVLTSKNAAPLPVSNSREA